MTSGNGSSCDGCVKPEFKVIKKLVIGVVISVMLTGSGAALGGYQNYKKVDEIHKEITQIERQRVEDKYSLQFAVSGLAEQAEFDRKLYLDSSLRVEKQQLAMADKVDKLKEAVDKHLGDN